MQSRAAPAHAASTENVPGLHRSSLWLLFNERSSAVSLASRRDEAVSRSWARNASRRTCSCRTVPALAATPNVATRKTASHFDLIAAPFGRLRSGRIRVLCPDVGEFEVGGGSRQVLELQVADDEVESREDGAIDQRDD